MKNIYSIRSILVVAGVLSAIGIVSVGNITYAQTTGAEYVANRKVEKDAQRQIAGAAASPYTTGMIGQQMVRAQQAAQPRLQEAQRNAEIYKAGGIQKTGTWLDRVQVEQMTFYGPIGSNRIYADDETEDGTFKLSTLERITGGTEREFQRWDARNNAEFFLNAVMSEESINASIQLMEQQRDQLAQKIKAGTASTAEKMQYYKIQDQLVEAYTRNGEAKTPELIKRATGTDKYVPLAQRIEEMQEWCNEDSPEYDPEQCDVGELAVAEEVNGSDILPSSQDVLQQVTNNLGGGGIKGTRGLVSSSASNATHQAKAEGRIDSTQATAALVLGAKVKDAAYATYKAQGLSEAEAQRKATAAGEQSTQIGIKNFEKVNENVYANEAKKVQAATEAAVAAKQAQDNAEAQAALSELNQLLEASNDLGSMYTVTDIVDGAEVNTNIDVSKMDMDTKP